MSIEKFLYLLVTKKLYFPRSDKFEDPWEGTLPKGTMDAMETNWTSNSDSPKFVASSIKNVSSRLYLSCWHENHGESAAMWDLYASRNVGVGIQTTVGQVKAALDPNIEFYIGSVDYVDFSAHIMEMNLFAPIMLKRESFSHEKEVRIVYFQSPSKDESLYAENSPLGTSIAVDIFQLIERVLVAPQAPDWHIETLRDIGEKYGLESNIFYKSNLYSPNIY